MTQRKIQCWVIPPEADAEFVAAMEDVLDTYEQPYDCDFPVLCMDERPVQLHKQIRKPIGATKRHARRVDDEYERCETACIFMFTEPLAGWREVRVRDQRTKVDWAIEMERLLKTRYRNARKVILVCDNLNTLTTGAFDEAFRAKKARELVRRIEFRHTPKHGSWLNMAENELSSTTRQCVTGRRFATTKPLKSETKVWGTHSNKSQRAVDWQFNVQTPERNSNLSPQTLKADAALAGQCHSDVNMPINSSTTRERESFHPPLNSLACDSR